MSTRSLRFPVLLAPLAIASLISLPLDAFAGMPFVKLTEVARLRTQALSFFLVSFVVLVVVIRALWNALAKELPSLPELTYPKALAVTFLFGLVFHLILTMISGARELMTPGAWERVGVLYKLSPSATPAEQLEHVRRARLEELRTKIWAFTADKGRPPLNERSGELSAEVWQSVHPSRADFVYLTKPKLDRSHEILAFEPGVYGVDRFVLYSDGVVEKKSIYLILRELQGSGP